MVRILITGASGFVGYHSSLRLSNNHSYELVLIDSLNPLFPTHLTAVRREKLEVAGMKIHIIDLATTSPIDLFRMVGKVEIVLNLAAFPGVRLSPEQGIQVFENNTRSFENIAQYCQISKAKLLYASSSSIYGDEGLHGSCKEVDAIEFNGKGAYSLSKWQNERAALEHFHSKSLESLGLRFFSVFGTYGRKDMAYYKFAEHISKGEPITVFESVNDRRDYTPIEYVVDDIEYLIQKILNQSDFIMNSVCAYDNLPILNVGLGQPKSLGELISLYEHYFNRSAIIINQPRKSMESKQTWSNNDKRNSLLPARAILEFNQMLYIFAKWYEESADS